MKKQDVLYIMRQYLDIDADGASIKKLENNPLFIAGLSEGNKKLKSSSDCRFIIWNLPAVITCPYSTPSCRALCYALKAEKQYKTARYSRAQHFAIAKGADFVDRMTYTICTYLLRPKYLKAKKIVFRLHESGDFFNKKYADDWREIARRFNGIIELIFMAYTKSLPYFEDVKTSANLVIRASLWNDTRADLRAMAENYPTYTAMTADELTTAVQSGAVVKCRCDDCGHCLLCMYASVKNLACEIH